MVYVCTDGSGVIKIGKTKDLPKRMRQIQPGNPRALHIVKTFETFNDDLLEKALHYHFKEYAVPTLSAWTKVSEWFSNRCLEEIKHMTPNELSEIMRSYSLNYRGRVITDTPRINPDKCWLSEFRLKEMSDENKYMKERIERLKKSNENKRNEINALKAKLYDFEHI